MTTATRVQIIAALKQLDVGNDGHWTSEGAPRMETMRLLTGDGLLDRQSVSAAADGFMRATASTYDLDAEPSPPPAAPPAVPVQAGDVDGRPEVPNGTDADAQGQPGAGDGSVAQPQPEEDPLAAARNRIRAAREAKERAENELKAAFKAEEALLKDDPTRTAVGQEKARADNVSRYLATQRAELAERGEKIAALKGVDLRAILPTVAPIDRAFARKTGFGRQRPNFPLRK